MNSLKMSHKFYLSKITDPAEFNLIRASLLQKLIRRGMWQEAQFIVESYMKSNHSEGLKRRLQIICAEDIGLGYPESVLLFNKEKDFFKIVYWMCEVPKNREPDRFLLTVANNPSSVHGRGDEILLESKVLNRLFNLSSGWYNSKDKKELNKLKDAFCKMAEGSYLPEVINQLGENYVNLTKAKIHGARCQIALATLIYVRKWPPSTSISLSDPKIEPKEFDEVFDFAIDMHTPIGKKLGRDFHHWINNCVTVIPEIKYPDLLDSQGNEKYPLNDKTNKF